VPVDKENNEISGLKEAADGEHKFNEAIKYAIDK